MIPPVFSILNASDPVKALLGTNPLRVFPWGEAPQGVDKPYATYGVFSGVPANQMDKPPDADAIGTQIDVWGSTADSCGNAARAIRDALESQAHMTSFESTVRDPETKLFRTRMDFNFIVER